MSVFDDNDMDSLEIEIRNFLENHPVKDLMRVLLYCIEDKKELESGDMK